VTSTVFQTSLWTATQVATVVVVRVDTSTILSTIQVTVESAATQTNVVWVTATVTALAKRLNDGTLPGPDHKGRNAWPAGYTQRDGSLRAIGNDLIKHDTAEAPLLLPRQDSKNTPTITKVVTQIHTSRIIKYDTTTLSSLSTDWTTVFQTVTR